jgi:hypothetical protein
VPVSNPSDHQFGFRMASVRLACHISRSWTHATACGPWEWFVAALHAGFAVDHFNDHRERHGSSWPTYNHGTHNSELARTLLKYSKQGPNLTQVEILVRSCSRVGNGLSREHGEEKSDMLGQTVAASGACSLLRRTWLSESDRRCDRGTSSTSLSDASDQTVNSRVPLHDWPTTADKELQAPTRQVYAESSVNSLHSASTRTTESNGSLRSTTACLVGMVTGLRRS